MCLLPLQALSIPEQLKGRIPLEVQREIFMYIKDGPDALKFALLARCCYRWLVTVV